MVGAEVGDSFGNVFVDEFLLAFVGGEGDEVEGEGAWDEMIEGVFDEDLGKTVTNVIIRDNDTNKAGVTASFLGTFGIRRVPGSCGDDGSEANGVGLGESVTGVRRRFKLEPGLLVDVVAGKLLGMDIVAVAPNPFGRYGNGANDTGTGCVDGAWANVDKAGPWGDVVEVFVLLFRGEDLKKEGLEVLKVYLGVYDLLGFRHVF